MKYKITIEEMVSEDFLVEADDMEGALKIAERKYSDGEFVLTPGNLFCKQICGQCLENNDCKEWYEF
ncbi:MAG: DpnD/PcfM family protein [Ruminococcus sp.]|nr:DpnD/PcfM family protein [Ruminococcus sp.]